MGSLFIYVPLIVQYGLFVSTCFHFINMVHLSEYYSNVHYIVGRMGLVYLFINHVHWKWFTLPKMNVNFFKVFINCIMFV